MGAQAGKAFCAHASNGELSCDELLSALRELSPGFSASRARLIMEKFTGTSGMTRTQFKSAIAYLEFGHRVKDELKDVWDRVDKQDRELIEQADLIVRLRAQLSQLNCAPNPNPNCAQLSPKNEQEWLAKILAEDEAAFGTNQADSDASAEASHKRGVTIGFLIDFTNKHNCWDWPTWKVVRDVVKPATEKTRCRYADLPDVLATGAVGAAKTFSSHCWGAIWGLMVAALADKADLQRRVWVDIFAVRQWPGNLGDLCFDKVVGKCHSFLIVCQAFETKKVNGIPVLGNMTQEQASARMVHLLPKEVRNSIAFLRIWCLAEVIAAIDAKCVMVMKTGHLTSSHGFKGDIEMTKAVSIVVDVEQAEAAVQEDRERILAQAKARPGGTYELNTKVTSAVRSSRGCVNQPEIQTAAMGDKGVINFETEDKTLINEYAKAAAGGGYLGLLESFLAKGADPGVVCRGGITSMTAAAQNGQLEAIRMMLKAPGGKKAAVEPDPDGDTALIMAAAVGCKAEATELLKHGAMVNHPNQKGATPLIRAAKAPGDVSAELAQTLIEYGANIDDQDTSGDTALNWACLNSNIETVKVLLKAGANPNIKGPDGGAIGNAKKAAEKNKKEEILKLLQAAGGK